MKRFLWLFVIVVLFLICTGCGDTFRPVIIPNPPKFPDPRASHSIVAISDNNTDPSKDPPQSDRGSIMSVDVSGDTVVGVADVGLAPVHAVQQTANQVLVVNHSVTGAIGDSLTKVTFFGTQISGTPTTISLPPNSAPNFVASTESGTAYVTLPNLVPDPLNFPNDNAVGVVNTSTALVTPIRVGNNPVAVAETPDAKKLYVANQGSGTISNFNTIDQSPRNTSPIALSSPPLWLAARSDSQRVFVLESNGTLAVLDTTSTAGPDTVIETAISVPGALSMFYDGHLNRLYIPGGSQLAIVDVAQSVPQLLKSIPMPQVPGLPPVNAAAVGVAALPDGSRAYVASVGTPQPSQITISAIQGDGATATYTYTLTGGHDLTRGIIVAVSGIDTPAGFDGTFTIKAVSGTACDQPMQVCTFQTANTTMANKATVAGLGSSIVDNLFPQVTVINTSGNTVKTTAGIAGFPDATVLGSPYFVPVCMFTRFRFTMAAGGDSSRVYLASCDSGNINVIDTATDSYLLNLPAPGSSRAPIPPSNQPPPQNPVFMIAGP
jgi:DNA-binding beta-propeller fold protein YncE